MISYPHIPPDFIPNNFFLCGCVRNAGQVAKLRELKQLITVIVETVTPEMLTCAWAEIS